MVTTFAEGLSYIEAITVDRLGSVYATTPGSRPGLYKFNPNGKLDWLIANLAGVVDGPIGEARIGHYSTPCFLPDGNILVGDTPDIQENAYRLRMIELGPAPLLTLSQASGSSSEKAIMTLTTLATNGVIRYTLNDTLPRSDSPVYIRPFEADANASLMARVFVNEHPVSDIVSNLNASNFVLKLAVSGQGTVIRNPLVSHLPLKNGCSTHGNTWLWLCICRLEWRCHRKY